MRERKLKDKSQNVNLNIRCRNREQYKRLRKNLHLYAIEYGNPIADFLENILKRKSNATQ